VRRPLRTAVAVIGLSATFALTACGSSDDSSSSSKPTIVTSTNVWGSVASAIAGDNAEVKSLISDPSADPHSYESTPSDAAAVTDADLVVLNGGGYDEFVEKILDGEKNKPTVDAYELLPPDPTATGERNEHVWYDITTVDAVAHKIADELAKIDPPNARAYGDRAASFETALYGIAQISGKIAADHPQSPVAQTEPIAHYLLVAANVDDLTPREFEEAIEEGNDPSASAVATTRDLLTSKKVRALVYNIQTEDKVTEDLRKVAESAGIRIVEVTETLPDGLDYIQWQTRNAEALAKALN
jgi:zinc/manganese transport system substrate-binding protein